MQSNNNIPKYAWVVLATSGLFLLYKYILQISPSVITNELMRYFHIDAANLGNLAATFFYSYLITQIMVGPIIDKFGPRRCTSLAIALSALGALLFSLSSHLWQAEIARALMGIGAAFATVSYMKIAAIWFPPEKFAFTGGLLTVAVMIGALSGQTPLAYIVTLSGWQRSLFYCAILGFIIALFHYSIVRDNQTGKINTFHTVNLKSLLKLLTYKYNWYLMFYSGLAFAPLIVFGGLWGNPFLQEAYHLSKTNAASFTSLLFIGLAIGGPLLGFISDKINTRVPIMAAGVIISFLSIFLVIYMPEQKLFLLGLELLLFGFGTGAFMLGFALGKEINPFIYAASIIALINTGDAIFGAFTEPLIGKFLDLTWQGSIVGGVQYFSVSEYQSAFAILLLYLLGALITLWPLRKVNLATHQSTLAKAN